MQVSNSPATLVATTTSTSITIAHSGTHTLSTSVRNSTTTLSASFRSLSNVSSLSVSTALSSMTSSDPEAVTPETDIAAGQSSSAISTSTNVSQAAAGNTAKGNASGPTYSELGIVTEMPKRPEYALKIKRLETFTSWPRYHHQSTEELAEAGFYYAGYGDCVRCFYCGGGLRNWKDDDDVWVDHARWFFPKCAYIRQQMGQVFVDVEQELNETNDQISFKMVMNKIGPAASAFRLDYIHSVRCIYHEQDSWFSKWIYILQQKIKGIKQTKFSDIQDYCKKKLNEKSSLWSFHHRNILLTSLMMTLVLTAIIHSENGFTLNVGNYCKIENICARTDHYLNNPVCTEFLKHYKAYWMEHQMFSKDKFKEFVMAVMINAQNIISLANPTERILTMSDFPQPSQAGSTSARKMTASTDSVACSAIESYLQPSPMTSAESVASSATASDSLYHATVSSCLKSAKSSGTGLKELGNTITERPFTDFFNDGYNIGGRSMEAEHEFEEEQIKRSPHLATLGEYDFLIGGNSEHSCISAIFHENHSEQNEVLDLVYRCFRDPCTHYHRKMGNLSKPCTNFICAAVTEQQMSAVKYENVAERLSTLQYLLTDQNTKKALADSGFFLYKGTKLKCYSCGAIATKQSISSPEYIDTDHARLAPYCAHLRYNRGDKFIHVVIELDRLALKCPPASSICQLLEGYNSGRGSLEAEHNTEEQIKRSPHHATLVEHDFVIGGNSEHSCSTAIFHENHSEQNAVLDLELYINDELTECSLQHSSYSDLLQQEHLTNNAEQSNEYQTGGDLNLNEMQIPVLETFQRIDNLSQRLTNRFIVQQSENPESEDDVDLGNNIRTEHIGSSLIHHFYKPQFTKFELRRASYPDGNETFLYPEVLAAAGFYYSGSKAVCCFFCGGVIRSLPLRCNIFELHLRYFQDCGYIRCFRDTSLMNSSHSSAELAILLSTPTISIFTDARGQVQIPMRIICKNCLSRLVSFAFINDRYLIICYNCGSGFIVCHCNYSNLPHTIFISATK